MAESTGRIDLYKQHKQEYAARLKPAVVNVGPAKYLAIDGKGPPGEAGFTAAMAAIYGMAFTIKMTRKLAGKGDYKVCHLEGLWGTEQAPLPAGPPDEWRWTMLVRTPDFVGPDDLDQARAALEKKKKPPEYRQVRLETIAEGTCVQMLHVGPYDATAGTVEAMRQFAGENGLRFQGRHHEIYLSDPRRVPPERLRTILRQPVQPTD